MQLRGLVSDAVNNGDESVSTDAAVSVAVQTEPLSWRSYLGLTGERRTLQPDLYAELVTTDYEDRWFIEVDCDTESMNTLLRKCQQYEDYRRSGTEQTRHGVFPACCGSWVETVELSAPSDSSRPSSAAMN